MTPRRAVWGAAALTLLVHFRALQGDFVYDDTRFVELNPAVRTLDHPLRFFTDPGTTAWTTSPARSIYRPLRTLTWAALRSGGAEGPLLYHLAGVLLHAAAAGLLVRLLVESGAPPGAAAAGALCFALHPRTVEVSAQISALGVGLATAGMLASLLAHARGRPVAAFVWFVVALFAKEHALVTPLLWAAWDLALCRERLRATLLWRLAPGLLLCGAFLWWRDHVGVVTRQTGWLGGSWLHAALTMLSGLGYYVATVLLPAGPTFDVRVDVQQGVTLPVLGGVAVVAALVYAVVRGSARVRLGALWFLIALAPVSNLVVPLKIPTADRFLYPSLAGLAFVLADLVRADRRRRAARRAVACALPLLAVLTLVRIGDWRTDESLNEARVGAAGGRHTVTSLWAHGAHSARLALAEMGRHRFRHADLHLREATRSYDATLRSMEPAAKVPVLMEYADLLFQAAEWHRRVDDERTARELYRAALVRYEGAHVLQVAGRQGRLRVRLVDEEVHRAAAQILGITLKIALPDEPNLEPLVKDGLRMAEFLQHNYAVDTDDARGRLILMWGVTTYATEPDKAERLLTKARAYFRQRPGSELERGLCRFYLSILPDRPYDRPGLERAYELFLAAAETDPGRRPNALFRAARCLCTIAKLFGDPEMERRGQELLGRVEKIADTDRLRREILNERDTCRSGR
ncbi:MAG: hypothetical protein ACE5JG_05340 [Planctomycetota bacterium]